MKLVEEAVIPLLSLNLIWEYNEWDFPPFFM